ncbi:hypothetical protein LTR85_007156 [Meristemomyces frigidus]|nr:hypothetical protein LTR85_007156 [Meristemomyces frigidus]
MGLMPRNTLTGLPDELLIKVVHHAVKRDNLRDIHGQWRWEEKRAHERAEALAPFMGNHNLLTIAEEESYKANTFGASTLYDNFNTRGDGGRLLTDFPAERPDILHLDWIIGTIRNEMPEIDTDVEALLAEPEVITLLSLPELYPNLQSLNVSLYHRPAKFPISIHFSGPVPPDEDLRPIVAWEAQCKVTNLIQGLRKYDSARLYSTTFTFVQSGDTSCAPIDHSTVGAIEVDATEGRAVDVWAMMDFQKTVVRFL